MALKTDTTIDGIPIAQLSEGSEKKVVLVCDGCGDETVASFSNYNSSQKRYKREGQTYCRPCSNKRNGLAKLGKPLPKACKPKLKMRGKNHPNYGGGRWIASDGYVMIQVGTRQYQREHLLVMEKKLGRPVDKQSGELVHHVDLDKANNDLKNLVLLPDEQAHKDAHKSLEKMSIQLIQAGLIRYSRNSNRYVASDAIRNLLKRKT
jgi:hypothetical protein